MPMQCLSMEWYSFMSVLLVLVGRCQGRILILQPVVPVKLVFVSRLGHIRGVDESLKQDSISIGHKYDIQIIPDGFDYEKDAEIQFDIPKNKPNDDKSNEEQLLEGAESLPDKTNDQLESQLESSDLEPIIITNSDMVNDFTSPNNAIEPNHSNQQRGKIALATTHPAVKPTSPNQIVITSLLPTNVNQTATQAFHGSEDVLMKRGQLEIPYLPLPRTHTEHPIVQNSSYWSSMAFKRIPVPSSISSRVTIDDVIFVGILLVCACSAIFGLAAAAIWWKRVSSDFKAAQPVEYGSEVGDNLEEWTNPYISCAPPPPSLPDWFTDIGDKIRSWRMKRSMDGPPIMLQTKDGEVRLSIDSLSDLIAQEDGDDCQDVYECPGLAETTSVEVQNPIFKSYSCHDSFSPGHMKVPTEICSQDRRTSAPPGFLKEKLESMKQINDKN